MATEEYSIGYQQGYQAGWNAAMDSLPQRGPLSDDEMARAWAVAAGEHNASAAVKRRITRAIEAALGIKH